MMYRWHPGYIAWLLNRVTGLAVTLYLGVHIWVIHHLGQGREGFDHVMKFIQSPVTMVFELLLIGAVLYHAINGVRIMLVEFAGVSRHQKAVFVGVLGVAGALFLAAIVVAIPHITAH
ncbi:succinate dehydrogenase, cytochrome b556 subunit [Candidatus Fermentibacteria bacterium]|nr:succinate dehydrogenase, cytochrome b556 subunit [Candidatus Fermentibacteria bacterium]